MTAMWNKLVKEIADAMMNNEISVMSQAQRDTLETDVKRVIDRFVRENIVQCYFKCDAETAKKAKGSE